MTAATRRDGSAVHAVPLLIGELAEAVEWGLSELEELLARDDPRRGDAKLLVRLARRPRARARRRESGMKMVGPQPIPYAFVVSLKAPKVKDLYNRVVRAYAQQLVPLRLQTRIQLRT